ncbi:hypothetical protein V2J09_009854 [Rumex salicifolius]
MKMEMLKHEKIFREQVHELHRLYRVQKLLMSNMERQDHRWMSMNKQMNGPDKPDHHHHHHGEAQIVADSNYNGGVEIIDESEIQLTLGPSVYKTSNHNHHQKKNNSSKSFSSANFAWNFTPSTKNGRQMNLEEENLRQEKHLPWLFQPLSLKLT